MKVLVVDDDARVRLLLRHTLQDTHRVFEARDGEEALRQLALHRPDVVLLDVEMPILDGLSVCREVRADRAFDRLAIVIVSGSGREVEALDAGADRYVPKPFRPLRLLSVIDDVIALRQGNVPSGRQGQRPRLRDAG